ncbi:MAG: hemolysin family protein [Flavobacteriales bacterium]|jgi:CBS domain containing-hemolysin-like protein|nr:hemolysin family protein [Flavobacteriales bacterium]MDG1440583.1 hemolysin family protein [Flavobacteriales bacterium]MDG1798308.1 hemolysin family protein [Flavobacteriales bacterium]
MSTLFLISIAAISLSFSAFFSGMEIAFISSNKLKIELDYKKGLFSAKILSFFSSKPAWFIAAMLIGNNTALVVFTLYVADLVEPYLLTFDLNSPLVLLLQTLFSTFFILLFAEFLPKAIFRLNPNYTLRFFSVILFIIYVFLWPLTAVVVFLTNTILKVFGNKESIDKVSFKKTDLDLYIKELKTDLEEGEEMEHDVKIFHNALSFSEVIARDCMVPRNEIIAMEINDNIEDLKNLFLESGHSRIIIYKDNIDNIIGYVHSIELFKIPISIKSMLIPVSIVPESMSGIKLLEDFIEKKRSVSVVVDEYGGTSGILTMEDIIEEIFGEIDDEHDQEELIHEMIEENIFIFSARLEIDFINEKYRIQLPVKEDYETLSGMIIYYAETIPESGSNVNIESFNFKIIEADDTKISKVQLSISKDD